MFVLVVLKDTVRVAPNNFDKNHESCLVDALHAKYANRVLAGHGLCLAVDGFDGKADAVVYANDGGCHVRVQFRLIVFRPFLSEVIIGKIRQCDDTGLLVSLEFFDHIFIPKDSLQPNSEYNYDERIWVWNVSGHELSMDLGEEIQFRVVSVEFGKRRTPAEATDANGAPAPEEKFNTLADLKPPLRVIGTIAEDGLGILSWWSETKPDADADAAADDTAAATAAAAVTASPSAASAAAPAIDATAAAPAAAGAFVEAAAPAISVAAAAAAATAAMAVTAPTKSEH